MTLSRQTEEHVWRTGEFRCAMRTDIEAQVRAQDLFVPWRDDSPTAAIEWSMHVLIEPKRLVRLLQIAAESDPVHSLLTAEGVPFRFRYSIGRDADLFIDSAKRDHAFVREGKNVTVLISGDDPASTMWAVRVFRELLHRESEEAGGIMMHAACIATVDGASLIVGPKGSGKTTAMLAACIAGGASYVGNDRVILQHRSSWGVLAFPVVCRIHAGTASVISGLSELFLRPDVLARRQHQLFASSHRDLNLLQALSQPDTKLELAPAEISWILGIPVKEQAPLRAVVCPRIDPRVRGVQVSPMQKDEAINELTAQCLTPVDKVWCTPWLIDRTRITEEMKRVRDDSLLRLADTVSCFRILFGYDDGAAEEVGRLICDLSR